MSGYFLTIIVLITGIWTVLAYLRRKTDRRNLQRLKATKAEGLTEPPSLHPVINPDLCIGSGACVVACPEQDVLGMIRGKAAIINPTHCIGHGACFAACPVEAITLVFGTQKRGVDIPHVKPDFETNVSGIFIAGELGGMGLIRNAVEQGRQAIEAIRKLKPGGTPWDVVIVGAGPAGFSAALACLQHKLRYVAIEQETLGGRVAHFPRGKIVMTQPATLPMVGKIKFGEVGKEKLLNFMRDVEKKTGVDIRYNERMEEIRKTDHGFVVKTSRGSYETRAVLLALGRGGTPRKLGVTGEDLPKVVYRLIDPAQYTRQHVFVVGGGDAALEAACAVAAEEFHSTVTLSYRGASFSRVKEKNRQKLKEAEDSGRIRTLLNSNVKEIKPETVTVETGGSVVELQNDAVIVCAGGILPTEFLKNIGIEVETKYGTA
ncbi:MAG: NAD(P)-binding domain-containing protein [Nitrospirae bacterium]|nr:NAD(P)-binding domain-containing protein [Nitrospirota bacterium]MBI3350962.1 NAD(P)-binding domain-containing protein [Nitrospirota bacterium]